MKLFAIYAKQLTIRSVTSIKCSKADNPQRNLFVFPSLTMYSSCKSVRVIRSTFASRCSPIVFALEDSLICTRRFRLNRRGSARIIDEWKCVGWWFKEVTMFTRLSASIMQSQINTTYLIMVYCVNIADIGVTFAYVSIYMYAYLCTTIYMYTQLYPNNV